MEIRPSTAQEAADWADGYLERIAAWWGGCDGPDSWPDRQVGQVRRMLGRPGAVTTFTISDAGRRIGYLSLGRSGSGGAETARVIEMFFEPGAGDSARMAAALGFATNWARGFSTVLWIVANPDDSAAAAYDEVPLRALWMVKRLGPVPAVVGVTGAPMTESEYAAWEQASIDDYAAQMAASGAVPTVDAARVAADEFADLLPDGLATADHTFLCVRAPGDGGEPEQVATNWIQHRREPGLSFVYGVEVHEGHRGKGYGRAAMLLGEQASLDAGDTHLALNVFGHNTAAIRLYETMGYRAVEHRRSIDL